jgi:hypothetical protein
MSTVLTKIGFRPYIDKAKIAFYRRAAINNKRRFELAGNDLHEGSSQKWRLISFYRISDGSGKKTRFPFATKEVCLKNFLRVFQPCRDDLIIIADNVGDVTWQMINALHPNTVRTSLRNVGSWRYAAFEIAVRRFLEDQVIYFVEDDYLHLPGSREVLLEGIGVADYVSLYDHKDKYINANAGGPNPFIEYGGELTRVVRTSSTHWKLSNSTTMTFATTVKVLREDQYIWNSHTQESYPNEFQAFLQLARKSRRLVTPVPSYATHCEPAFAAPGVDWASVAKAYI